MMDRRKAKNSPEFVWILLPAFLMLASRTWYVVIDEVSVKRIPDHKESILLSFLHPSSPRGRQGPRDFPIDKPFGNTMLDCKDPKDRSRISWNTLREFSFIEFDVKFLSKLREMI